MNIEKFSQLEQQLATRFKYKLDVYFTDCSNLDTVTISLKLNEPLDSLYKEYLDKIFHDFKQSTGIKYLLNEIYTNDPQKLCIIVVLKPETNL